MLELDRDLEADFGVDTQSRPRCSGGPVTRRCTCPGPQFQFWAFVVQRGSSEVSCERA
jgi:hypothetical protein